MPSDITNNRIRKIKQDLIRAQVLFQRRKQTPSGAVLALQQLHAPERLVQIAIKRDERYNELSYIVTQATLLLHLALVTGSAEDFDKVIELFHPRQA